MPHFALSLIHTSAGTSQLSILQQAPNPCKNMPPKREGSGSRQPGNQQFSFVTFQHPSGAKDDNARREVRSHVTTLQHRLSRQKRHAAREEAYQELQRRNQGLGQPILPHPAPTAPEEEVPKEDSSTALQGTSQSGSYTAESSRSSRQSGFSKFYSVDPSKKTGKSRAASPSAPTSTTKSSKRSARQKVQAETPQHDLRAKESAELEQEDEHSADTALEAVSNKTLTPARFQPKSEDGPYGDGISTQFDVSSRYARVALLDDPSDSVAKVLRRLRLDFSSVMVGAQSPSYCKGRKSLTVDTGSLSMDRWGSIARFRAPIHARSTAPLRLHHYDHRCRPRPSLCRCRRPHLRRSHSRHP